MSAGHPPRAKKVPKVEVVHGDRRVDDYAWLRDDARKNPEVLAYLEAENEYTGEVLAPTAALQEAIFQEIKSRVKETDLSVPYDRRGWLYYTRTEEGQQYAILCRRKPGPETPEHVYLDENELADGLAYFDLGDIEVSTDNSLLAYATDTDGSETYTLFVKEMETGRLLPDRIHDIESVVWAATGRHFFYSVRDAARRPWRVFRHELGADPATDVLVYEELDNQYNVSLYRTRDDAVILIGSGSSTANEWHWLAADRPVDALKTIEPRRADHEYDVDHHDGRFFIRTNFGARNFRVMTAPVDNPGQASWQELLPARDGIKIDDIETFKDFWVAWEREKGLPRIRITTFADGQSHHVDFPDQGYAISGNGNANFDTPALRFNYQSFVTPPSVYDYQVAPRIRTLLKQTEVLGGYDPALYATARVFVTAYDRAEVPVSLVHRRDTPLDGSAPLILYGYGSYGISLDPSFNHARLSLLDRGVIFALAHLRGGGELGEEWHDQGKLQYKRNTFTDFITCAEHLVRQRYTSNDRLAAMGGSAGGLLMGAVLNMRPDLFQAAVAQVPFVDVLNTMLDATLPLTTGEYLEWGNPNEAAAYSYMRTYCPYTNIAPQRYPDLLVTAGLNDPRVSYWEAAKYVARLRAVKLDERVLLLRTNMGAGHAGASGRYDAWREAALYYAFLLTRLGILA